MRSMINLESFSLIRHHRTKENPSKPWADYELYKPTRSNISSLLNSLPASCINLEVVVGDTEGGPGQTHLCEDLRRLLPRMVHVHVDLDPVCDEMLGTWDYDKIFHPISLPCLESLHFDCFEDKVWTHRRPVQTLKIWHSLVPALQQVATLSDTPSSARITALGVSPEGLSDDLSIHPTYLRCDVRRESSNTKTWAFPVSPLPGPEPLRAVNYIRMRDGESYVAVDRRDVVTIAGEHPWRTLATGTRLPTDWTRGKELMPDYGIFDYEEWIKIYPKKRPLLILNEELCGQRLISAEEREGYQNTENLVEKTPKGYVRYGGPVWQYDELFDEEDEGPEGLTPDAPNANARVGCVA
ncbi:hypothetical protein FVEN_g233 [Fusarium venenatum]|uniref:Uncharacterized protein n=2 Tax=Fusarium venenatum TaxID=56646 RepID=A0A2L2T117_9HYPO|nr:uncharacterized protein FVRRES_07664 [Fusarium venenatum]KAG8362291.1 hypothetical protein FVEN_g233 [Fusarium venenatum]CEI63228.1 unnamed protein product [Fusarium venenatum]